MPARRTNSLIPLVSDSMVTEPLPKPRSFGRVALTIVSSEMRAHRSPNFCCPSAGRCPLQTPRVEVSVHPQCLATRSVQEAVFLCIRQVIRSLELSSWLLPGWTQAQCDPADGTSCFVSLQILYRLTAPQCQRHVSLTLDSNCVAVMVQTTVGELRRTTKALQLCHGLCFRQGSYWRDFSGGGCVRRGLGIH
jgi:hypothetical protein